MRLAIWRPAGSVILVAVLSMSALIFSDATARDESRKLPAKIVREISASQIEARVKKLVSFGTRHSLSETESNTHGVGAARRWIAAELNECSKQSGGRLQVALDEFVAPVSARVPHPTKMINIVATLPGTQPASRDRLYVVSGHYDSMPSNVMDGQSDAPGANDDASGTAAVMELACVMSKYSFDATLVFMAVVGEEQGLIGSTHWAKQARDQNLNIQGMFTNDIIGSSRSSAGKVDASRVRMFAEGVMDSKELDERQRTLIRTGGENDSVTRELARFVKDHAEQVVSDMRVDLIYRRDRYLRGGDHAPFLDLGFPALRFTESNEDFHHQHQNVRMEDGVQFGDLTQFVDYNYITRIAKINGAALATLALGPAAPRDAEIETIRLENDTTLRWVANTESDLAGYRIVWRDTTAPYWQHSKDVGNVTRYTLPNVSKDNFVFGVVAVDKEGNDSVASYPRPYRPTAR